MHKITKNLKKKKNKTKKSKHKEEELFKPEELEAYRKEHQQESNSTASTATGNDEWKKFNALTSGIDNFLKKTQDDLDRIKSTSFFQRIPPPSEVNQDVVDEPAANQLEQQIEEATSLREAGIVQVSESDSEEENEDDIFDTAYIDALATGDLKLAYIPDSPTDEQCDNDPFDTSIAERAILGPTSTRRGQKLVSLGSAVEVLTGRVQAPTCVPIKRPSARRTVLKEKNLLCNSFDNDTTVEVKTEKVNFAKSSLLDDDTFLPHSKDPIDLSKSLYIAPQQAIIKEVSYLENKAECNQVPHECPIIYKSEELEDEEDKQFALLAAESISKPSSVTHLQNATSNNQSDISWEAFQEGTHTDLEDNDDPFDTTFAENIVPGKFVLKVIEDELLKKDDLEYRPPEKNALVKLLEEQNAESRLKPNQSQGRDLLGGSITDLTTLGDQPLDPKNQIEYTDPFDTSIIEKTTVPGQTELKFLEKELLSDLKLTKVDSVSDDEFDPRADEVKENYQDRKFSTSSISKTVAFTLPITESKDIFNIEGEDNKKISKPLTPYYVRENSIPEKHIDEDAIDDIDPFDTSFVGEVAVGKEELKLIETLVLQPESNLKPSISDQNFNPRDDKQIAVARVVQVIKEVTDPVNTPKNLPFTASNQLDLLGVGDDLTVKVLTPATTDSLNTAQLSYSDPFDTSIAINILPGKAELKLLETELVNQDLSFNRVLTDPDFNPCSTVFNSIADQINSQEQQPNINIKVSFDIGSDDKFDPFDTSNIGNTAGEQIKVNL